MWDKLKEMTDVMREEHRIKHGTDWNYVVHYGEVHILCPEVYKESIAEYMDRFNIKGTIHTF